MLITYLDLECFNVIHVNLEDTEKCYCGLPILKPISVVDKIILVLAKDTPEDWCEISYENYKYTNN